MQDQSINARNLLILKDDLRRHEYERYLLTLFAPRECRANLSVVLALNLELSRIPGVVSQPVLGQMRLAWWRDSVASAAAGDRVGGNPVLDGLAGAFGSGVVDISAVIGLIDAWERDLIRSFDFTLAEFESDAGAIGAALARLRSTALGVSADTLDTAGRHQGIAWALAKLIRAIPHVASRGQLNLPAEFSLPEIDPIRDGIPVPELIRAVRGLAEVAWHHVNLGRDAAPPRRAFAAFGDGVIVARFLHRLEDAGHNPFDSRLTLPDGLAPWGLSRAWLLRRF